MPPQTPVRRTRVDLKAEDAALLALREGRKDQALKILMVAYGDAVTGFIVRLVRNPETARDISQHVFLEAFVGLEKFENRSSVWSWLCAIAYHRSMDELKRSKRSELPKDFDVWTWLAQQPDTLMDEGRVDKRRALEQCLGKLEPSMRAQVLMRLSYSMSYAEIGEAIGEAHGTVQVRISRVLPKLQKCLREKGFAR
jgi:RNA polymerase sigma-70 factor, ECF subfamily